MYNNENNENNEINVNETIDETVACEDTAKVSKERKPMSRRAKFRTVSGIMTALFVVAVIIINVLIGAVATRVNTKIDLTKGKILDFADETIDTVKALDKDVKIYSLIPESYESMEAIEILYQIIERYQQLSTKISFEKIDAATSPMLVEKCIEDNPNISLPLLLECGDNYKTVDVNDIVTIDQNGTPKSINAEQKITSAIMYVTSSSSVKVGVLQGHDEVDFETFNTGYLKPEFYDGVEVNLSKGDIPDDIDMLIINSPARDFSADEIKKLDAYFDKGGKAQVILAPLNEPLANLEGYLKEWGVTVYSGLVFEKDSSKYVQNDPLRILPEILEGDITDGILDGNTMLPYYAAVGMKTEKVPNVESNDLLISSDTAYVKLDAETSPYQYVDGVDMSGPTVLATMLTRFSDTGSPTLMVMAGPGIFSYFDDPTCSNKDFYYNSMAHMTDKPESIYIRPKDISPSRITMTFNAVLVYAGITVILLPLVILIAGFVIWFKRRHL